MHIHIHLVLFTEMQVHPADEQDETRVLDPTDNHYPSLVIIRIDSFRKYTIHFDFLKRIHKQG